METLINERARIWATFDPKWEHWQRNEWNRSLDGIEKAILERF